MSTSAKKRPGRVAGGRRPNAAGQGEVEPPVRSIWTRTTRAVLGAGAIATAIGAVVGLWPSGDAEKRVHLTDVRVVTMPLSEYQERDTGLSPVALGGGARTAPLAGPALAGLVAPPADPRGSSLEPPDPDPAASDAPDPDTTDVPQPSGSPTGTVPSPSGSTASPTASSIEGGPSGRPLLAEVTDEQRALLAQDALSEAQKGLAEVQEQQPGLDLTLDSCHLPSPPPHCHPVVTILTTQVDPQGLLVEPGEAAERVVAMLGQTRTTRPGRDGRFEPLGVLVTVNIEAAGLRRQPLLLSWSVLQQDGDTPLPRPWRDTVFGSRIEAESHHDTGFEDLWIPKPSAPGRYVVRITVEDGDTPLASIDSPPFD